MCRGGGGEGEGTMIFLYIRRLRPFLGFKILYFNIFWCFQKNEYFWGHDESVDFYGVHHKSGHFLGVISINFGAFSQCTVLEYFLDILGGTK